MKESLPSLALKRMQSGRGVGFGSLIIKEKEEMKAAAVQPRRSRSDTIHMSRQSSSPPPYKSASFLKRGPQSFKYSKS